MFGVMRSHDISNYIHIKKNRKNLIQLNVILSTYKTISVLDYRFLPLNEASFVHLVLVLLFLCLSSIYSFSCCELRRSEIFTI